MLSAVSAFVRVDVESMCGLTLPLVVLCSPVVVDWLWYFVARLDVEC